ncbi:histidine phosphotransferase family protein [Plastorhodobacter daqingensis]|uniref:Histidine phosphotransferase family protein n=1 Tax=Plastorhodobacter daqingensis TaxID=1387281 RepID=A0ABW2UN16_9RHOB
MTVAPDLSALLASRICHDLISPLGAIGNGLELMRMAGTTRGPEADLIAESVLSASARIRFFRVAFGAAALGQRMGRPEILSILADMTAGSRLRIDWQPMGDLPRHEVRLAFLLLQCLETAMPYGGAITVTCEGGMWEMTGLAPRLRIETDLWDGLEDPSLAPPPAAAQVHFALVPPELRAQGRSLRVETTETRIRLRY